MCICCVCEKEREREREREKESDLLNFTSDKLLNWNTRYIKSAGGGEREGGGEEVALNPSHADRFQKLSSIEGDWDQEVDANSEIEA